MTANTGGLDIPADKVLPDPILSELLTASQVAAYLRVKKQTVTRYAKTGKLHGTKVGNAWVFTKSELARAMEEKIDELGD